MLICTRYPTRWQQTFGYISTISRVHTPRDAQLADALRTYILGSGLPAIIMLLVTISVWILGWVAALGTPHHVESLTLGCARWRACTPVLSRVGMWGAICSLQCRGSDCISSLVAAIWNRISVFVPRLSDVCCLDRSHRCTRWEYLLVRVSRARKPCAVFPCGDLQGKCASSSCR